MSLFERAKLLIDVISCIEIHPAYDMLKALNELERVSCQVDTESKVDAFEVGLNQIASTRIKAKKILAIMDDLEKLISEGMTLKCGGS